MSENAKGKPRRKRINRSFPAGTFADSEAFAKNLFDVGGGQAVKRLTLFDELS